MKKNSAEVRLAEDQDLDRIGSEISEHFHLFQTLQEVQDYTVFSLDRAYINGIWAEGSGQPNRSMTEAEWDHYYELKDWVQTQEFILWLLEEPAVPKWLHQACVWALLTRDN